MICTFLEVGFLEFYTVLRADVLGAELIASILYASFTSKKKHFSYLSYQ